MKKAVFFDRDGTLIESVLYLNRVDQVRLLEGAADVLKECSQLGYLNVIVTNQAAIGKGVLTERGLQEIQEALIRMLAEQGARLDAWYFNPHTRKGEDREAIEHPDRKPGPGMLLRAAREHDIDLGASFMVGDMVSDTLAGKNAGCRATVLVKTGLFDATLEKHPSVDYLLNDIRELPPIVREAV